MPKPTVIVLAGPGTRSVDFRPNIRTSREQACFDPNPPRDDDVNRRPLLQNSVAFHASMATELCDRQSVDSTHHPSVTLKRSFMRQGLLLGEAREDDNDQSAGMP